MSKKVKVLLILLAGIVATLAAVFYIVSTKIDPELIRKSAINGIESNLRNVEASIADVSYSLGFTVKLKVQEVEIKDRGTKARLAYLKEAKVEVPVLSILTNGGTVDIKVKSPELIYKELPRGGSNWKNALPEPTETKEKTAKEDKKKKSKKEMEIPSFIENSKIDISIGDLGVKYFPMGAKPSEFNVKKILFKNLNLKKTTAFEIVSSIKYGLDEEKTLGTDIQLVGEVALKPLIETGAIDTNLLLTLENIKLSWLDTTIPDVKNTLRFKTDESGTISVTAKTNAGSALNLDSDIEVSKDFQVIDAKNLSMVVNLGSIPPLLGDSARALEGIDFGKSQFKAQGSAKINLGNSSFNPGIDFGIEKPISAQVAGKQVNVSMKGKFVGENLALKLKNELMSGVATLEASTRLNPLKLPDSLKKYHPIKGQLLITNIQLDKPFIQSLLYGGKEEEKAAQGQKEAEGGPKETRVVPIDFPTFELGMEGKHIFVNKVEMNLSGKIFGKNNKVSLPGLNIVYGSGRAKLKADSVLRTTEDITASFRLGLDRMEMSGLNAFLPPIISGIEGRYEGSVDGKVRKTKALAYDVNARVAAKDGELKNLNLSSILLPLIENISLLKGKVDEDKLKISDKFESMSISCNATEKRLKLNNFRFVGHGESVVLKAKGTVAMKETGKSSVKADLIVADVADDVKAYSGSKEIPVLLEGNGFALLPKAKYTTDRLSERVAKQEIGKQKKKIEKQIKKEQKKIQKDLEKKAKDLLKGFKL